MLERRMVYGSGAIAGLALIAVLGCASGGSFGPLEPCASPAVVGPALQIFGPPFSGERAVTNVFDHDVPLVFVDGNDYQLTTCGQRARGSVKGHNGYDWPMPVGTALLAVAEGKVALAGSEPPLACPPLGRTVAGLVIVIRARPTATDVIDAIYGHVSRVDVQVGDTVHVGDVIGASGDTGCALEPHLHFSAARVLGARGEIMIDPYGWSGPGADPWSVDARGAESAWLWRDGSAPRVFR